MAFAIRSALRVLPLVVIAEPRLSTSAVALPSFRAMAVPWAVLMTLNPAVGPTAGWMTSRAFVSMLHNAALAGRAAANVVAHEARAAGDAQAHAANAIAYAADAAAKDSASDAAYAAANATNAADAAAAYAAVNAAHTHVAAIYADMANSRAGSAIAVAELAVTPLWPGEVPGWAAHTWAEVKRRLLGAHQNWEVWVAWYEDRLAGRQSASRLDRALPRFADEFWKQGPQKVNSEIKGLIDEFNEQSAFPDEDSMPRQAPGAASFQRHESGVIGTVHPEFQDRLADTDEVRDFYSEVLEKTGDLLSLGANMLGPRLQEKALIFHSRLPEDTAQAVERRVWSSGNTLRSILATHDLVADDRDPHPDKLDKGAAERLRDVVGTFNQLAVADPALRRRELEPTRPE